MKYPKTVLVLLLTAAMLLSLCACGKKASPELTGAYTAEETAPSEEALAFFAAAVKDTEYADYTPVTLLGTQVVAGTNYKFLCDTPDGTQKVVVVYRDLEQSCSVLSVEDPE